MPGKIARSDPRPSVQVTRGAGSGQPLTPVLQEGQKDANIDASLGFIWRISDNPDWTEREPRPAPMRSFRVVSSFGLQPCARAGAVADLVSR
jgi:hypothetical protein